MLSDDAKGAEDEHEKIEKPPIGRFYGDYLKLQATYCIADDYIYNIDEAGFEIGNTTKERLTVVKVISNSGEVEEPTLIYKIAAPTTEVPIDEERMDESQKCTKIRRILGEHIRDVIAYGNKAIYEEMPFMDEKIGPLEKENNRVLKVVREKACKIVLL